MPMPRCVPSRPVLWSKRFSSQAQHSFEGFLSRQPPPIRDRDGHMPAVALGAALLSLVSVLSVRADEADINTLAEIGSKAAPLRDAWEQCTAAVVRHQLNSTGSAEAVAERALTSCERHQTKLRRALEANVGRQQARTVVEQLRRVHASSLAGI